MTKGIVRRSRSQTRGFCMDVGESLATYPHIPRLFVILFFFFYFFFFIVAVRKENGCVDQSAASRRWLTERRRLVNKERTLNQSR